MTVPEGFNAGALIIDAPGAADMRVHLEREQYTLGRSSMNDLAFPEDQKLSREHLVFARNEEGWTVRDMGSKNGTLLNGVKLTTPTLLSHADEITAGHLFIRYDSGTQERTAGSNQTAFIEGAADAAVPVLSVDLKSALRTSTDSAGRPGLENTHLGALVRAGRELAGQSALETLFELILELSLSAVEASRGIVTTCESDGTLKTRASRGEGLTVSAAIRDLVINKGKSVVIVDTRLDENLAMRESIMVQGIRSILAVPLQTEERVIGLLYLDSPHLVRGFSAEDLNVVTVMANIAAIRIEHARLMEEEQKRKMLARDLERAAEIQRRLLPASAPEIPGFDLAGYNAPCRTVGGDYFDFVPMPYGRLAILIGDVSGKGMGAALLVSHLQAATHLLFEEAEPLVSQISRLNRSVSANCPRNCFITLFAAILDLRTNELVYCNAGHNPPLVLRADDKVEQLAATGFPLGILRDALYDVNYCRLESGDVLVLYSDGVTEAASPDTDEDFGDKRLIAAVRRNRDRSSASIIEAVSAEVQAFTGGTPAADDVTLVLVRRY